MEMPDLSFQFRRRDTHHQLPGKGAEGEGDQEEAKQSFFSKETKKRRKIQNDKWLNGRWKI
jgi:hypothetical protein